MHHVILHSHRALHSLQWPLVSDSWTWGEVKFIMATLNLNRRCNPFIPWNYLFYYAYSSNFHANRTDVSQFFHIVKAVQKNKCSSGSKRHYYPSSETRLRRILPRPHRVSNSHIVPLSISHTTQVTQTTNVGLKNAFISASGTRRLRGSFTNILPKVSCSLPFLESLNMPFKILLFVVSEAKEFRWSYYSATDSAAAYEFLLFPFGVIVKTSWIQCGQTLIPMRFFSES